MFELDARPFAGQRSDVPPVRQRTPSPVRKVLELRAPPLPARDLDVRIEDIDVIYAEDEEVFRETAILELLKVGFTRANIHEADNGVGALEHLARLQVEGHVTMPLLVLLDVRMPGMDGRECALQIQELVKRRALRREPFVVCISSIHKQVTVDEGKGNFQVVLSKPINKAFLDEVLALLRRWWALGHGRQLSAWKKFDPSLVDIIAADAEPVCRLASTEAFTRSGVSLAAITEADDEDELLNALVSAQDGDPQRPLIMLLGTVAWTERVRQFVDELKAGGYRRRREPFVVCTSIGCERAGNSAATQNYHAFMPKTFSQSDAKWVLEFCRLWWQTRGDAPDQDVHDDESEPDSASVASVMSDC